jgi:hypothetical protein
MDQELKQYLDEKFAAMNGKFAAMDGKFAAMDGKFAAMDGKFATKQDLERVKTTLLADLESRFATKQDLERVETALLTEFHKWASPAEARARTHAAALRAIDLEMESITERVQKLEDRN